MMNFIPVITALAGAGYDLADKGADEASQCTGGP